MGSDTQNAWMSSLLFFRPASPKGVGRLIVSPMVQRHDSISSSNASSLIDDTVRTPNKPSFPQREKSPYHIEEEEGSTCVYSISVFKFLF